MRGKKSIFLKEYAKDLDSISMNQLKIVIKIAGSDVGILVSVLVSHLRNVGASKLTEISRYLFATIDFAKCFSNKRYNEITELLFQILSGNACEDFKVVLKMLSCSTRTTSPEKFDSTVCQYPVMIDIPFDELLSSDWDTLIGILSLSDRVCNLYQFFDAILQWLHLKPSDKVNSAPRLVFSDDHVKDIIDIKKDRCWDKMSTRYLSEMKTCNNVGSNRLVQLFLNSDELSVSCIDYILLTSEQKFNINRVFTEEFDVTLVSDDKIASCMEDKKCALMLHNMPSKSLEDGENYSLSVVNMHHSGNENIHYHDVDGTQNVGLLIAITSKNLSRVYPIPFNTPPIKTCFKKMEFWNWGFLHFGEKMKFCHESLCKYASWHDKNAEVKFMACVTQKTLQKD
jgi:hypothetical protein